MKDIEYKYLINQRLLAMIQPNLFLPKIKRIYAVQYITKISNVQVLTDTTIRLMWSNNCNFKIEIFTSQRFTKTFNFVVQ